MQATEFDALMMQAALRAAAQSRFITSPNPRIGCVLVQGERIIGQGATQKAGDAHAEVMALRDAQANAESAIGATAYVTLEPCSHTGRTPPCVNALIAAGIKKVFFALRDPNPLVAGRGEAMLRAAGIETHCGLLGGEALRQNLGFYKRMTQGLPWLRLKTASSLDGFTALANGQSQWITGSEARADNQIYRASSCAVLTGIGTVLTDNPQMNVRLESVITPRQPLRIIFDSRLQTPPTSRIVQNKGAVILYTQANAAQEKALSGAGACLLQVKANAAGQIDLADSLKRLAEMPLNELHLEAGARLGGAFVAAGLVDELLVYQAPILLGAGRSIAAFELSELSAAPRWQLQNRYAVGADLAQQLFNPTSIQTLEKLCLQAS